MSNAAIYSLSYFEYDGVIFAERHESMQRVKAVLLVDGERGGS
jgi:hypothetical protein